MSATIMLVDSNSTSNADWKAFLENHGYVVVGVQTGGTAIRLCPEVKPDMVLLKSSLQDMPGFQVCKMLKEDPVNRLMPVIMVGVDREALQEGQAYEAGADDFWSGPASLWDALNRLDIMIQLKSYIDQQAEDVLFSLARSLERKNPDMTGHSERLAEYAVEFAESLGMSPDEIEILRMGCLLHDIGKIAVPDRILLKPEALTHEEMKVVKRHPIVGEQICAPMRSFRHVLPLIRHHHERPDGSGYPDGLMGDGIPLAAQVLQIVDIYDALTTNRPYRIALSSETALAIMESEACEGRLNPTLMREFNILVWTTMPRRTKPSVLVEWPIH